MTADKTTTKAKNEEAEMTDDEIEAVNSRAYEMVEEIGDAETAAKFARHSSKFFAAEGSHSLAMFWTQVAESIECAHS
jgi:hypothetical protein